MSKTVFVGDAHLKGPGDPNQQSFVDFLGSLRDVETLVILGDLFDFWTGSNEVARRAYFPVLDGLLKLAKKNVRIIYLEGNHDFAMGPYFTDTLNASVYPDECSIALGGKKFYLAHGDRVDMTTGYALWRAFLRSSAFRLLTRALTPANVWKVAMYLSTRSRKYNGKGDEIESRLRRFAGKKVAEGFDGAVLGHSHAAGVHKNTGAKDKTYANPGSWARERSYLVYDKGEFRVERFRAGSKN